jgi:hypothetical protein
MKRLGYSIMTLAFLMLAGPGLAVAGGSGSPQADREGLMLGVGVGIGEISCAGEWCDGVTEAAGIELHVGSMVSPRAAVGIELWSMGHTEDSFTVTHTIATVTLRYWLVPRLWLQGGLGVAQGVWRYSGRLIELRNETEYVPAMMGAVGYEILIGRAFAMDLQLRGGTGYYDDDSTRARNVAVGLGFTWF